MKILFVGNLERGSLSTYRAACMAKLDDVDVMWVPTLIANPLPIPPIVQALAFKLRLPLDVMRLNRRIREAARAAKPDVFYCESVPFVRSRTLKYMRREGVKIVGMSQDYITARHNSTLWQERALKHYDLFFTTKSFGIQEFEDAGVRDVRLINNSYESTVHRPMTREEVGDEFEAFDCVFIGTFERDRAVSLRRLAESGLTVLVHGNAAGRLSGGWSELSHPNIVRRPAANDIDYTRAMHRGKVALAFLRKLNRDQITTRSIEIPAMARPMLAERTDEHDKHFKDGQEYLDFANDDELVSQAHILVRDPQKRRALGEAGRLRCLRDRYDNDDLIQRIVAAMRELVGGVRARVVEPA